MINRRSDILKIRFNYLLAIFAFFTLSQAYCFVRADSELLDSNNDGVPDGYRIKSLKSKATIHDKGFEERRCLEISSKGENGFTRVYFPVPETVNNTEAPEYYLFVFRAKISDGLDIKGTVKTSDGTSFGSQNIEFMAWKDRGVSDWMNVRTAIELKPGERLEKIYANVSFKTAKAKAWVGSQYFEKINKKIFESVKNNKKWEIINENDVTPKMLEGCKKGNILRNSGFELGSTGYSYPYMIYQRLKKGDAFEGEHTLTFEKNGMLHRGLMESLYYRVTPGRLYTFSAYIKAKNPNTGVSLKVLNGYQWSKNAGGLSGERPGAIKRVKVGTEWERIHFSFVAQYASKSCIEIFVTNSDDIQLDAMQLEEGLLTSYKPDKSFDIGLQRDIENKNALYKPGERVEFNVDIYSITNNLSDINLSYIVTDYWNNEVLSFKENAKMDGKRNFHEKVSFIIPEPGVYKLRVEYVNPENGCKVVSEERSFGVLPDRIAKEADENSYFGSHIPWGKDIRTGRESGISWVRLWDSFLARFRWNEREPKKGEIKFQDKAVDRYASEGYEILAPFAGPPPAWSKVEGKKYNIEAFKNFVYKTVSHFKGKIKYWEVFNEPYYEFSSKEYAELLKAAYSEIKRADPNAKVVGVCGYMLPGYYMDWIEGILKEVGTDYMDIISTHSYLRTVPEFTKPSYTKRLELLREMIKKYGKKEIPIWDTESTAQSKTFYGDRLFGANTVLTRQCNDYNRDYKDGSNFLVRQRIVGIANGVEKSFYYSLQSMGTFSQRYINPTNWLYEYTYSPHPVFMAHSVLINVIDGAEYIGEVFLGEKARCYLFEKNNTPIAALWRVSKEKDLTEDGVILKDSPPNLDFINIMGGKYQRIDKKTDTQIEFRISGEPVYIKAPGMSLEKFRKLFENARIISTEKLKAAAFAVRESDDTGEMYLKVRNITSEIQAALIKIKSKPELWKIQKESKLNSIKPNTTGNIGIPIEDMTGKGEIKAEIYDPSGKQVCEVKAFPRDRFSATLLKEKIIMDGSFKDWPKCETVKIADKKQIKAGTEKWSGENDLSATLSACYDSQNLYFSVRVKDEKILVEGMGGSGRQTHKLYKSDCVEFFFEPDLMTSVKQDIYQFFFVTSSKEQNLKKIGRLYNRNKVEGIEIVSVENSDGYDMEIKIPLAAFDGVKLKQGSMLGFDFTINDRDQSKGKKDSVAIWHGATNNYCDSSNYGIIFLGN